MSLPKSVEITESSSRDGLQSLGALIPTADKAGLISDLAASGQRVYAVHFPFPGLGHMQKGANGVVWVAE